MTTPNQSSERLIFETAFYKLVVASNEQGMFYAVVHKEYGVTSAKSLMLHEMLQMTKALQEADDKILKDFAAGKSILPEGSGKQGRFSPNGAPVLS